MPDDGRLRIECPDCGAEIVLDARSGRIVFHGKAAKKAAPGRDFDRLLSDLDASKARADAVFDREMAAFEDRDRRLEEKFEEALRRAAENPDEPPPPRPFDLD